MKKVEHPAKFSKPIIEEIKAILLSEMFWLDTDDRLRVLDPFAGVGTVHELPHHTVGVEIEPEWAMQSVGTIVGDALDLPFPMGAFDAIVTSPVYGNRMSDHHEARDDSKRNTYRHTLGRPLHPHNSGQLQWGPAYEKFHLRAWNEAIRVLKSGGLFVLNISDHIRKGEQMEVTKWHESCLTGLFRVDRLYEVQVETQRQRQGENHLARVAYESIIVFRKCTPFTGTKNPPNFFAV